MTLIFTSPLIEYFCYMRLSSLCSDIDLIEIYNELLPVGRLKKCHLTRMDYFNRLLFLKQHTLEHRLVVLSLCTFYDIYHKFVCCNILDSFVCHNTCHV